MEPDHRVTMSLHPENLTKVDGYGQDTLPLLKSAEGALSLAYSSLSAVHTAREMAKENPTWNEAQQILETDKFATQHLDRIAKGFQDAFDGLDQTITAVEKDLTAPVTTKAAAPIAAEIRAYVGKMDGNAATAFLNQAIRAGDETTVTAILGAPAYLSGISEETKALMTREWHEANNPAKAKQLRAMVSARDMLHDRWLMVGREMQKAIGAKFEKINSLRKAKTKAEEAFILRDAA